MKPGDTIGLVTPGSPVSQEQLSQSIEKIEALGFRVVYTDSVLDEYGYFAGRDEDRAAELMQMYEDDAVDAIWCVRGGYGCIRILDHLNYASIRSHPKLLIGYSDITAILNAQLQHAGLVGLHGPLGISDFNAFTLRSLTRLTMKGVENYGYPYKREKDSRTKPEFDHYVICKGEAEGLLVGGNISVLDSMIGSAFEPDFRGKIVFLEEIEERTYRVDRMLFHLLSSTSLPDAAGIVLGVFADCNINDKPSLSLKVALHDLLAPLNIPVAYGFPFGHIDRQVSLPLGIRARFDAGRKKLELLEAAVR
ncbi:MAG: LD-carboxypeptidase [Bacteroidetes bacterium]|nr:MAG: LD-carboxypeptidase [Bacteroidota bacterium]